MIGVETGQVFFRSEKVVRNDDPPNEEDPSLSSPAMATTFIAVEPSADYCDDQALWDQWQQLFADNPTDDSIVSLYAFRWDLCSMVFPVSVRQHCVPPDYITDAKCR